QTAGQSRRTTIAGFPDRRDSTRQPFATNLAAMSHHRHFRPLRPRSAAGKLLEIISHDVTAFTGSSWAFAIAAAVIIVWLATGPLFHFSDTWQLMVNTGTTVVTFLMVFLIQRSQNKESLALQ